MSLSCSFTPRHDTLTKLPGGAQRDSRAGNVANDPGDRSFAIHGNRFLWFMASETLPTRCVLARTTRWAGRRVPWRTCSRSWSNLMAAA